MADRRPWEVRLYQFAVCLTKDPGLAQRLVTETIDAAIQRPPAHADGERIVILQFQQVRKAALKAVPPVTTSKPTRDQLPAEAAETRPDPDRLEAAIHGLAEPGRSGLALLLLDAMDADAAAKLLGLTVAEFSDAVHGARVELHKALTAPAEVAT